MLPGSLTPPAPRRVRLVLHAKVADQPAVRVAVDRLRAEGVHLEVRVTWEAGDGVVLAAEAARAGVDVIVAGGGDGTVNEVVRGLLDAGVDPAPALAVMPVGTANDFAYSCGVPLGDPFAALRLAAHGEPVAIDVGRVGGRYFVNLATGGFGTRVTTDTPPELKRILGGVAYLLTGLGQLTSLVSRKARLVGPGFAWEGRFFALAVGNGRIAGGGVPMCPDALLNDGLLDVVVLPDLPMPNMLGVLTELMRRGMGAIDHLVIHRQLPWLEVEAADGLQVNLDGEPMESTRLTFDLLPGHLRVLVGERAPLLPPPPPALTVS